MKKDFEVVMVGIKEIKEVLIIENESFNQEAFDESTWESILESPVSLTLGIKKNNELASVVSVYQDGNKIHIISIATLIKYRGLGYANVLLDLIFKLNQDRRFYFYAETRKSNKIMRNLFEKNGFYEKGIEKNYYDNPLEDAIIYVKGNEK